MTNGTPGRDPGSPSGPCSPDSHRQRAGGPGESSRPEGAEWSQVCFRQVCDVSANVGSADASLVVAFVCKVNKCAAPVGSVENRLVLWRTFSHHLLHFWLQLHPKKGNFLVPQARELGLPV